MEFVYTQQFTFSLFTKFYVFCPESITPFNINKKRAYLGQYRLSSLQKYSIQENEFQDYFQHGTIVWRRA